MLAARGHWPLLERNNNKKKKEAEIRWKPCGQGAQCHVRAVCVRDPRAANGATHDAHRSQTHLHMSTHPSVPRSQCQPRHLVFYFRQRGVIVTSHVVSDMHGLARLLHTPTCRTHARAHARSRFRSAGPVVLSQQDIPYATLRRCPQGRASRLHFSALQTAKPTWIRKSISLVHAALRKPLCLAHGARIAVRCTRCLYLVLLYRTAVDTQHSIHNGSVLRLQCARL